MPRGQVKLLDEPLLASSSGDATAFIRITSLSAPYTLEARLTSLGTDPGSHSVVLTLVAGAGDATAGPAAVTAISGTLMAIPAMTAVPDADRDASPEDFSLPLWVKLVYTATLTTANDGLQVECWLSGERNRP